ncbi:hypothetical protein Nepgr_029315 [Nepenthes gracilis]|uniref:SBP-type domain-containing protein n=1 Tax=Nepenthes gracilis TaxID=150966 RepID=A0AAD3TDQ8_NEPGR|nr:hypothetical protein Nepgr_029315 [Nepenthes gracilis]
MTELNSKGPFFWDWENLVMFNSKELEVPKKLQIVDSEIVAMEEFEAGPFYSSGCHSGGVAGGSASDLGYRSSSKSFKSASYDSSTNPEATDSKFKLDNNDSSQYDLSFDKELPTAWPARTSSTTESSAALGESLIGLKLGKRTYFEDVSAGGNAKTSLIPVSPAAALNRSKSSSSLNMEIPHCQVEGCNLNLSSAKEYHRKHRVCESHSKSPMVIIGGLESRFCQQCSRFHKLSEFDQKKRSCRKRLSDHNARRRKPKPNIMQFDSRMLPSSLYGLRVYTPSSNEEEAHDLGALSLLSANSWVPAPLNPTKISQPFPNIDALPLFLPPASSAYWQGGQPVPAGFQPSTYQKSSGSHFQEFQLFREPQEPSFYL